LNLADHRCTSRSRVIAPQSAVEFSPVELVGLEILVGLHPIDRFAKFVQIANGVAIAVGIKKSPHGFDYDIQLIDG
jgi:hypothetical protein